jgi:hypothetical protein
MMPVARDVPAWQRRRHTAAVRALVAALLLAGCTDGPASSSEELTAVVGSVEPWDAGQGETVQVRILGSGFSQGDVAVWERRGSKAASVVVEETRFVSAGELIATVRIGAGALPEAYDVAIRNRDRKKGIATEIFNVLHGIGSTLAADLSFSYDGDRTGTFAVRGDFTLDPEIMYRTASMWGVTLFHYPSREQVLMAQQPVQEGPPHFLVCWSPGGMVEGPGTRPLECWIELGTDPGPDGRPIDASYSSWIGGNRPADGTGSITFTAVSRHRLGGTFRITMHADNASTYPGPLLDVRDGRFDLPVVSSYFDQ